MTPFIRLAQIVMKPSIRLTQWRPRRGETRQGEATSAAAGLAVGQVEQPMGGETRRRLGVDVVGMGLAFSSQREGLARLCGTSGGDDG